MTLTLNEKEKRAIAALIHERIDEHLSRFPYARYPVEPLEEWKRFFCDPKAVSVDTLKQALSWHFGGWQRKDLALSHKKTIAAVLKAWPEFAESGTGDPAYTLRFWEQKLTDWHHGFNAVAFLLHLLRPDSFACRPAPPPSHDGASQRDQSPGEQQIADPLPAGFGALHPVLPVHPAKAPRNGLPRPVGPLLQSVRQPPRLPKRKGIVPLQGARNPAILLERLLS